MRMRRRLSIPEFAPPVRPELVEGSLVNTINECFAYFAYFAADAKLARMKSTNKPLPLVRAPARRGLVTSKAAPMSALTVSIEVDPLIDVVRRHVKLSPQVAKVLKGDFVRLFQNPALGTAKPVRRAGVESPADPVLSTQEAADLVGVSRPYIVARIVAGDIPLHQQIGNQRRVRKSAVVDWHQREQARRRRALGQLGADLDSEIFAG